MHARGQPANGRCSPTSESLRDAASRTDRLAARPAIVAAPAPVARSRHVGRDDRRHALVVASKDVISPARVIASTWRVTVLACRWCARVARRAPGRTSGCAAAPARTCLRRSASYAAAATDALHVPALACLRAALLRPDADERRTAARALRRGPHAPLRARDRRAEEQARQLREPRRADRRGPRARQGHIASG